MLDLDWVKNRYAQLIAVSWAITVDGTSVEFPAITERQRDGQVLRSPQASALGPGKNDLGGDDLFDRDMFPSFDTFERCRVRN